MKKILILVITVILVGFSDVNAAQVKVFNENMIEAYKYDQTNDAIKCITGEESTCVKATCHENDEKCLAGTIIKYKVNDETERYFYVLHDNGATLTLQDRENVAGGITWYSGPSGNNTLGPISALLSLESATSNWSNVNDHTYTMGTTVFIDNAFTGCSSYNSCTKNGYTLEERTAKARMITVQEAAAVGCTNVEQSCPIWMYNYLSMSTNYGGTVDNYDVNSKRQYKNQGYWTMSTNDSSVSAWYINYNGSLTSDSTVAYLMGVRPVVEIDKYTIVTTNTPSDNNQSNDDQSSESSSNTQTSNQGAQTVKVEDTFRSAYIGYCIGVCILVLGIMVLVQVHLQRKRGNK